MKAPQARVMEQNAGKLSRNRRPIDVHVGACIRLRRTLLGITQEELAEQLGISYQQVQKYEKGTNRICASKLAEIAHLLHAPISFFFSGLSEAPGVGEETCEEASIGSVAQNYDLLTLNCAFLRLSRPSARRAILNLVRCLGDRRTL